MNDSATISAAREALARLRERQAASWDDWITVGHGLVAGRQAAMRAAKCNKPFGRRYSAEMRGWLDRNGLGEVSPQERHVLLKLMGNLPAISGWRDQLDERVRRRINHPGAAWWKWRRATGAMSQHQVSSRWAKVPLGLDQAQVARASDAIYQMIRVGNTDCMALARAALLAATLSPKVRPSRRRHQHNEARVSA